MLAVDLAFHEPVHGVEKVLAVIARVESQNVRRQHVQQHLALPRANAEGLGIGPRDVPEQRDGCLRDPGADELRQQREVKILDQHHGAVRAGFR